MQIKTITCHDVYNVGASLQAYALASYLQHLDHQVEIIDYKPEYLMRNYCLWGHVSRRFDKPGLRLLFQLAKLPFRIKERSSQRKKNFDTFTHTYLPLTAQTYTSINGLQARLPQADVYFAGSDQIWNSLFPNGKDPAFYLQFGTENSIRASYAASFAGTQIDPQYEKKIQTWLNKLDYISVREVEGLNLLKNMGIEDARVVLDPVFLLTCNHWQNMAAERLFPDPYIFVYDFDGSEEINHAASELSQQLHLPLVSLQQLPYTSISFPDAGPLDFLSLVQHADFVLSNSFHATALSIIFERQFRAYPRNENINTRMRDFAALLGIPFTYVGDESESCFERIIDYESVRRIVEQKTVESKAYIDLVLAAAEQQCTEQQCTEQQCAEQQCTEQQCSKQQCIKQ